ncbi:hypothetical protein T484DRAFT_1874358 [Baffinella frigidus]|nr:hypothetical protein T484DRAFT_1874358 [Cryptophyta sp. CCMP2293]
MGTTGVRVLGIVALGAACCLLAAAWAPASGGEGSFVELFADPGQTERAQKQWRELVKSEETNNGHKAVGFHRHRRYHVAAQMRSAELGRMVHRQHLNYLPLLPKAKQPPKLHCLNAECMRDHVIYDTAMRVNKQHNSEPLSGHEDLVAMAISDMKKRHTKRLNQVLRREMDAAAREYTDQVTHEVHTVQADQHREARQVAAEKRREHSKHQSEKAKDPNSGWLDLF